MKNLFLASVLSASIVLPLYGEDDSYILAVAGEPIPAGTVAEYASVMSMSDGVVKVTMQGQPMDGSADMKTVEKRRVESLADGSYRYLLIEEVETQKMTMMGQPQEMPAKVNPLVGKPVMVTKGADGVWVAKLEEGEATPDMISELEDVAKGLNEDEDAKLYGTVPRKVGDEWDVESADLMGIDNGAGTFKVKFEGIEDFQGERCAKITGTYEIKGLGPDADAGESEMTISLKGDYLSYRSLEGRYDVRKEMKGSMVMESVMEPQPGMTMEMNMSGNMTAEGTIKIVSAE
ncbi:MAG: hypothetical protein ABJQ29_03475 [Luteolibacter sp.]